MRALKACLFAGTAAALSACGSATPVRSGSPPTTGTTATSVAESTSTSSTAALQTTVPDCGAGAYRPQTLLVTCVTGGIMVTGIEWTTWASSGAAGAGTVHMTVGGRQESGQADLALSKVEETGSGGPRFSLLTVTWIGRSPDGHPSDTYQLAGGS